MTVEKYLDCENSKNKIFSEHLGKIKKTKMKFISSPKKNMGKKTI
jgi:hypothetical protein